MATNESVEGVSALFAWSATLLIGIFFGVLLSRLDAVEAMAPVAKEVVVAAFLGSELFATAMLIIVCVAAAWATHAIVWLGFESEADIQ